MGAWEGRERGLITSSGWFTPPARWQRSIYRHTITYLPAKHVRAFPLKSCGGEGTEAKLDNPTNPPPPPPPPPSYQHRRGRARKQTIKTSDNDINEHSISHKFGSELYMVG